MRLKAICAMLMMTTCVAEAKAISTLKPKANLRLPHDPLTKWELESLAGVLRAKKLLGNGWYLQIAKLQPPSDKGEKKRQARFVVLKPGTNERMVGVIDLSTNSIISMDAIRRGQPAVMADEYARVTAAVQADVRWQEAIRKRGITDLKKVYVETWAAGDFRDVQADLSHRLMRSTFFYRDTATNPYARPIEGLTVVYDATLGKVVDVIDTDLFPVPERSGDIFDKDYLKKTYGSRSKNLKPLEIMQRAGSSIELKNHQVEWENWKFHVQVDPREGLVLTNIGRTDGGEFRSILHRASLSEMIVPYGDPTRHWYWRCAFDEGDYGVGILSNSLIRGVHFPSHGVTVDAVYADNEGRVKTIQNAVAMYERDGEILWSHYDMDSGKAAARRGRELVVQYLFNVGNYDYGMQWIFKQDGSIDVQMMPTGIVLAKTTTQDTCARCAGDDPGRLIVGDQFGSIVEKNLIGVVHQHFFNFRLDFAIDGERNNVAEITLHTLQDDAKNPFGNGFYVHEELFKTEKQAMRDINSKEATRWWIYNPNKRNRLGHFAGYLLEPWGSTKPLAKENGDVFRRAPFLQKQLWVTKYYPNEMHAAGEFPNQNFGEGLPAWVNNEEVIINEDIVVWYTFGISHMPSAEDWPVMPLVKTGFTLKPMGFFDVNPGINID